MRYLTKEWYLNMQHEGLCWPLEADASAATFSNAYYEKLYLAAQEQFLEISRRIAESLGTEWNCETERKRFADMFSGFLQQVQMAFPERILGSVADIRVLALGKATGEVKALVEGFLREKRENVEQTLDLCEAQERASFGNEDTSLLEQFYFHDEEVKSTSYAEKDWILDFGPPADGYCQVQYIIFKNARIQQLDGPLDGAWWLYEELYRTDTGYEVHVLLDKGGLIECVLSCDDVILK